MHILIILYDDQKKRTKIGLKKVLKRTITQIYMEIYMRSFSIRTIGYTN